MATPSTMTGITHGQSFSRPLHDRISRPSRLRELRRNSPFAVRATKCSQMQFTSSSHTSNILEMVEPARGTKASAHGPWGVYSTAWELEWATNTPQQPCTALPTPYSTARMRVVRWGAHHLLQLGPPWGLRAMPLCPRDGRALIGHLRGPNTPHHNRIRRCRHRIRRYRVTVRVSYGGVHTIFSM